MGKVLEFPKRSDDRPVSIDTFRQRKYVFDLAEHRRKLVALQQEVQRIKRSLLKVVKGHGEDQS